MSIKKIEITESPDDENYVEYEVIHNNGTRGGADLRIMELDKTHHMRKLLDKGLPSGSKIAETFFYPHGNGTQSSQGIGSAVLEFIIKDAQERGIRAIYADVTNTIAESFFHKNGFDILYGRHYYRILS